MNGESSRPLAVREFLAFSLSETRDVGRRRNMRLLRRASTPRGSSHPLKFYLLNYKSVHVWSPAQRENAQPWTCWLLFPNLERQSRASPVENNQRTRGICGQEIPKHGNVYDTRKSKYFPVNSHFFQQLQLRLMSLIYSHHADPMNMVTFNKMATPSDPLR